MVHPLKCAEEGETRLYRCREGVARVGKGTACVYGPLNDVPGIMNVYARSKALIAFCGILLSNTHDTRTLRDKGGQIRYVIG